MLSILWCCVLYHSLGWLDRCTSMGKGIESFLFIAHVCLHSIVPRSIFQVHDYDCLNKLWVWLICYDVMSMIRWSMNVHSALMYLYERIAHIVIPIDLCINIWKCVTLMCYVKGLLTYKYIHTCMKI